MESTMKEFMTNDQEYYYSGITCIKVNGKNTYELKGKFLDDLHNNAFDETNGEDAVKHIEYFLRIVDPIDLPNIKESIDSWVNLTAKFFGKYDPPSRTGNTNTQMIRWDHTNPKFENWLASKFINYKTKDIFTKGALWDYWKIRSDEIEPTDAESSDLEETDHNDEQEIGEIFRIKMNLFNYETPLCKEFKEFNYLLKIDPDLLTKDIKGFKTYKEVKDDWIYEWNKDDSEWYEALEDSELKEDALRSKAIIEGLIDDDNDDESHHEADEREELCEIHELPVCTIRRFEIIKYSFKQDEEYVAVKEDEYDDLARTSDDACRAY
ncbi:hypothetical protein Tco_0695682 [Tanacetum coccineum]